MHFVAGHWEPALAPRPIHREMLLVLLDCNECRSMKASAKLKATDSALSLHHLCYVDTFLAHCNRVIERMVRDEIQFLLPV